MRKLYQQRGYSVAGREAPTLESNLKRRGHCKCSFTAGPQNKFLSPNLSSATYFKTFKPSDKSHKDEHCKLRGQKNARER